MKSAKTRFNLLLVLFALAIIGCQSRPKDDSTNAFDQSQRLMAATVDYQLPAKSIPPTQNADPNIDRAIHGIERIAADQGLMFDGSRAAEGIVIIGRPGRGDPMLVALALYEKNGSVMMQDSASSNGLDSEEVERMHRRFMAELRK